MSFIRACPKCLKTKPLEEYRKVKGVASGNCYDCVKGYQKEYNKKRYASPEARASELKRGIDKYKRVLKPQRMERKLRLINDHGGKCNRCGYHKNAAALDFHHINPAEKQRTVSHLLAINKTWAFDAAIIEANKCELLCSNCHREDKFTDWELKQQDDKSCCFKNLS
jgi:5-methylcytosine-specific restriction endonuclease McrA